VVTHHVSKTFNAPMDFVFDWCTDYREDDPKMLGSKLRRRIIDRTPKRVVWWVDEGKKEDGSPQPIRAVWLHPPDAWHLETCGDGFEIWDYRLTALGRRKTRLDMEFKVTVESLKDVHASGNMVNNAQNHWDRYGRFLERDYAKSLK